MTTTVVVRRQRVKER